jgi:L-threonylcarbamoyladenylate synthase
VKLGEAAAIIGQGGAVAMPTETVYGLACDATDGEAVARVYALKGRPAFNPLIVHVVGLDAAEALAGFPPLARELADAFWPGPLTLVLPRRDGVAVASLVTAGLPTIALRVPAHPLAQALIAAVGRSLAAPSANASGRISPTRASHVALPVPVLDGGPCAAGIESTIIGFEGRAPVLLRAGAIPAEALGVNVCAPAGGEGVTAPGQLASHYAPRQPVRLDAVTTGAHEFHIGFGPVTGDLSLSADGDLAQAAARLFDALHIAEASGRSAIAVAPIPQHGLGAAINDRLRRAAAPRA